MTIIDFLKQHFKAITNPERFTDGKDSLTAIINATYSEASIEKLANLIKAKLPKEQYIEFCNENHFSDALTIFADTNITNKLYPNDPNYSKTVMPNVENYFSKLVEEVKKVDPNFDFEKAIDEQAAKEDTYLHYEKSSYKVLENDCPLVLKNVENFYGKNSQKYSEFEKLLNFANDTIVKSNADRVDVANTFDAMTNRNKARIVKEVILNDNPILKNSIKFNNGNTVGIIGDGAIRANDSFLLSPQPSEECKKLKIELSPEYKQFLKQFIPKLIENKITCKGEEATKSYAFLPYSMQANLVIKSVNDAKRDISTKANIEKLHDDLISFKSSVDTIDSLFNEVKENLGNNYMSSCNIDNTRNLNIPPKYRFDIVTSSHLNAMTFIAGFIKDNRIDLDEFLEDPMKFEKFTFKKARSINQSMDAKLSHAESKLNVMEILSTPDDVMSALMQTENNDNRVFEALTSCEINDEFRKQNVAKGMLRCDVLGLQTMGLGFNIAMGNFFPDSTIPEEQARRTENTAEIMANLLILKNEDINMKNLVGGIILNPNTMSMEPKLDREEYIKNHELKNLSEIKEDLLDFILDMHGRELGLDRNLSTLNVHTAILAAQKAAVSLLEANVLTANKKEFLALLDFAKNPYKEYNKTASQQLYPVTGRCEKIVELARSNDVQDLEMEYDIHKAFSKAFANNQLNKQEYSKAYASFIGAQLNKLEKKDRTEEKLAEIMQKVDRIMEEKVFKKHGLEYTQDLKHGAMNKEQTKKLSRKLVPAHAAVEEAGKNVTKNLQDGNLPKDEKVLKAVASLNNLEDQHKDRRFSLFHIPSYYREWKAIKNLKQQILDAGVTLGTLQNAQNAIRQNKDLMTAFEGSPMATKLYVDAKDQCIAQYRQERDTVQRTYNLEALNERLHNDLNVSINNPNNNVPVSQRVDDPTKVKVKTINEPTNQELKGPY